MEEIDYKLERTRISEFLRFRPHCLRSYSISFSTLPPPPPPILRARVSWYRSAKNDRRWGLDSRHGGNGGDALKKTRVIWQSATLCHIKKAASSLNNVVPVISQSAFFVPPPCNPRLEKGEPSNRVAFSFRPECKWLEFGSRRHSRQSG